MKMPSIRQISRIWMSFFRTVAPNPSELLNDAEFGKLLKDKKEEYDYIFIDTPPPLIWQMLP